MVEHLKIILKYEKHLITLIKFLNNAGGNRFESFSGDHNFNGGKQTMTSLDDKLVNVIRNSGAQSAWYLDFGVLARSRWFQDGHAQSGMRTWVKFGWNSRSC